MPSRSRASAGGPVGAFPATASVVNGVTVVTLVGLGGDDYTLDGTAANGLFRLYGDGTVNAADFSLFRPAFGSSSGQAAYVEWLDLDRDGVINAFDFAQFRTRFGSSVP